MVVAACSAWWLARFAWATIWQRAPSLQAATRRRPPAATKSEVRSSGVCGEILAHQIWAAPAAVASGSDSDSASRSAGVMAPAKILMRRTKPDSRSCWCARHHGGSPNTIALYGWGGAPA